MDLNLKLFAELGDLLPDPSVYQRPVDRLIKLTNTRLDLTFCRSSHLFDEHKTGFDIFVSVVSQFMHSLRTSHLEIVYYILRYLKTCPGLGLFFKIGAQSVLSCYTNVDYVLFLASVPFKVVILYPGKVRSKLLSPTHPLQTSVVP